MITHRQGASWLLLLVLIPILILMLARRWLAGAFAADSSSRSSDTGPGGSACLLLDPSVPQNGLPTFPRFPARCPSPDRRMMTLVIIGQSFYFLPALEGKCRRSRETSSACLALPSIARVPHEDAATNYRVAMKTRTCPRPVLFPLLHRASIIGQCRGGKPCRSSSSLTAFVTSFLRAQPILQSP